MGDLGNGVGNGVVAAASMGALGRSSLDKRGEELRRRLHLSKQEAQQNNSPSPQQQTPSPQLSQQHTPSPQLSQQHTPSPYTPSPQAQKDDAPASRSEQKLEELRERLRQSALFRPAAAAPSPVPEPAAVLQSRNAPSSASRSRSRGSSAPSGGRRSSLRDEPRGGGGEDWQQDGSRQHHGGGGGGGSSASSTKPGRDARPPLRAPTVQGGGSTSKQPRDERPPLRAPVVLVPAARLKERKERGGRQDAVTNGSSSSSAPVSQSQSQNQSQSQSRGGKKALTLQQLSAMARAGTLERRGKGAENAGGDEDDEGIMMAKPVGVPAVDNDMLAPSEGEEEEEESCQSADSEDGESECTGQSSSSRRSGRRRNFSLLGNGAGASLRLRRHRHDRSRRGHMPLVPRLQAAPLECSDESDPDDGRGRPAASGSRLIRGDDDEDDSVDEVGEDDFSDSPQSLNGEDEVSDEEEGLAGHHLQNGGRGPRLPARERRKRPRDGEADVWESIEALQAAEGLYYPDFGCESEDGASEAGDLESDAEDEEEEEEAELARRRPSAQVATANGANAAGVAQQPQPAAPPQVAAPPGAAPMATNGSPPAGPQMSFAEAQVAAARAAAVAAVAGGPRPTAVKAPPPTPAPATLAAAASSPTAAAAAMAAVANGANLTLKSPAGKRPAASAKSSAVAAVPSPAKRPRVDVKAGKSGETKLMAGWQAVLERTRKHPHYMMEYTKRFQVEGKNWKKPTPGTKGKLVLGLDCEMVYAKDDTNALARVTIVDVSKELLNLYVRRDKETVLDFRTHISGVEAPQLLEENGALPFDDVQQQVLALISPETILVGHALQNDLKALKICHTKVVDTALLFRVQGKNDWQKHKLRSLVSLMKSKVATLQSFNPESAHDSRQDAEWALQLALYEASIYPKATQPMKLQSFPTKIFVTEIPKDAKREEVQALFAQGTLSEISYWLQGDEWHGRAAVSFASQGDRDAAIAALARFACVHAGPFRDWGTRRDIPKMQTELEQYFSRYGRIAGCKVFKLRNAHVQPSYPVAQLSCHPATARALLAAGEVHSMGTHRGTFKVKIVEEEATKARCTVPLSSGHFVAKIQ